MQALHKPREAQLSLEFLLVMAGFAFAIALFAPIAIEASKTVLFAMETEKAGAFLSEFKSSALQISFLSNGTTREIKASPSIEWHFRAGNGLAQITIKSGSLNREKTLSTNIPLEVLNFSSSLKGNSIIKMEKINNVIFLSSASVN